MFANLCLPDSDAWEKRWEWGDPIQCATQDDYDETEHLLSRKDLQNLIYICWIMLIIFAIVDLISEVLSLILTKCLKPKESLSKRVSTWMIILADVAIIVVLFHGKYNNVTCVITVII